LNWENKTGTRRYFWTAWESKADARANGPWEVSFPHKVTKDELEKFANENWALPENEDGEEDIQNFSGIEAIGVLFMEEFRALCGCKCGCANELIEGQPLGDMCNDCFIHCIRPTSPRGEMRRKMEER
jgi:hypothetical protein